MARRRWIARAIRRPGALTQQARRSGLGVKAFSAQVRRHPSRYSGRTRRRVQLRDELQNFRRRRR
jgi:hypothetical protein